MDIYRSIHCIEYPQRHLLSANGSRFMILVHGFRLLSQAAIADSLKPSRIAIHNLVRYIVQLLVQGTESTYYENLCNEVVESVCMFSYIANDTHFILFWLKTAHIKPFTPSINQAIKSSHQIHQLINPSFHNAVHDFNNGIPHQQIQQQQ